ncbi:3'(2'),5'-bisphosphate nucleotidase CysQ [Leifsonia sp. Root112D2]|uniref:3'(2'),5'-bisphosphate nucleotidase CysQ n=1 Tax=Leifsonia sp. Root112D2 TaxID=1736426 RepID=UPI0006FF5984|nr:3'(2'),5'-bisphosphate nucleotidase CysQ [Leifsonia sp. Root112D2]KQV06998.1 3'(2'),5'-bisphosphate nucleotidase CysQ [Leifsonia sp. Root112D2]
MPSNVEYAADLALGAGRLLRTLQRSAGVAQLGTEALRKRGDRASQEYLMGRLESERSSDSVLSEEAPDSSSRLSAHRVWIIDPLDGTREFAEGRDDWAVHVALWEDGELVAGAVALPGIDEILTSADVPRIVSRPPRIRLAVSRSRPPALVGYLAEVLDAELVPLGSAGYKTAAVVRGEADAYVHAGGQYEWDSAAPVAVARQANLFTSRIDGSRPVYNQPDVYLPDLVVCDPTISELVLGTLSAYRGEIE